MMLGMAAWGIRESRKAVLKRPSLKWAEARMGVWDAKWELLVPVVTMGLLFSGFATPVEAAAFTALYAVVTQTCLHRDLSFRRDVPLRLDRMRLGCRRHIVDAWRRDGSYELSRRCGHHCPDCGM